MKAKRRKPGPAPTGIGIPLQVRMPLDLLDAIDVERRRIDKASAGAESPPSRADVVRTIVRKALVASKAR